MRSSDVFQSERTTQLHVVCKCALSYISTMTKFKTLVQGALTLQINWSSAKTKKTVSEVSKLATKNKGMPNGFAVDHTLTFSLPNKIILLFKVPLCNDFFRSFHLLFGVIFIANMN